MTGLFLAFLTGVATVTDLTVPANWFWWRKRVEGAAGETHVFRFPSFEHPHKYCVGPLGPALSRDGGKSWSWLGPTTNRNSFVYAFASDENVVDFAFSIPYVLSDWPFATEKLTTSRRGRPVPYLRFGRREKPQMRFFLTARHHACEATASFALEGVVAALRTNARFTADAEAVVVPFMDVDGVALGEQGKGRLPHDHNRDYGRESIYPEVRAFKSLALGLSKDAVPSIYVDFHCPLAGGVHHEQIFSFGPADPDEEFHWNRYRAILVEEMRNRALVYDGSFDFPYGTGTNVEANYRTDGTTESATRWFASSVPNCKLAFSQEIGYARAGGVVTPDAVREFGEAVARTLLRLMESR